MKRKALFALVALSLSGATAVQAQDYDDRWYVAPYLGAYHNDDDRFTDSMSVLFGIGLGRYVAPNSSIDVFLDRTSRSFGSESGTFSNTVLGASLRHYFGDADSWRPYVMAGAGLSNHRSDAGEAGYDFAFQAGGGVSKAFTDNVNFRAELGYRYDFDDETIPSSDNFGDWMLNLGVTMAIGEAGEPAAEPEQPSQPTQPTQPGQPQTDCHTLDDDKDGVNNCDDRCPATEAGKLVGPDGCPQKVVIDLRGVNFDFDKSNLRPDAVELLDQAVDTLKRYPEIKCEVAGHTDAIGTDEYNQGLSERRAKAVWDYLTGHGIDAARLSGPNGYGESRPIAPNTKDNGSDDPEGRARNRRTELVVE